MAYSHLQKHKHETFQLSSGAVSHIWRAHLAPILAVIIVQHGFAEYAECYITSHNQFIHHLTAAGYAVYPLDMWGHGRSPGTRGFTHVGKAVQDHMELRNFALRESRPIILLGHSLGGLVTAGSTVIDSGLLAGVIMTTPTLPKALRKFKRVVLDAAAAVTPGISIPIPKASRDGATRGTSERHRYQEDDLITKRRQIRLLLAATAVDTMDSINAHLERCTVPTLVLHGTADTCADWRQSEKFVARIRSDDKTFKKIEGGYHELLRDFQADFVLNIILKWIDEHIVRVSS